jgi:hypothetical protein
MTTREFQTPPRILIPKLVRSRGGLIDGRVNLLLSAYVAWQKCRPTAVGLDLLFDLLAYSRLYIRERDLGAFGRE